MLKGAIVGCGRIAGGYRFEAAETGFVGTHAEAYQAHPAIGALAICDTDRATLDRFGDFFGIERRYNSAAEMLAAETPDIVSLCTPPATHQELLAACVAARVPAIWAEKPEGEDPVRVAALLAEAKANGTRVLFNYPRRFDVLTEDVGHIVRDRRFGSFGRAVVHYSRGLWHNGGHPLDLLLGWFGPVVEHRVLVVHETLPDGDVRADVLARFEAVPEAPVYLLANPGEPANFFEYDLHFETAHVRSTFNGMGAAIHRAVPNPRFGGRKYFTDEGEPMTSDFDAVMGKMLDALVQSIQAKRWDPFNGEDGARNLAIRTTLIEEAFRHVQEHAGD